MVDIRLGDIYEDCNFDAVVCIRIDRARDELCGVSLTLRDNSFTYCSPTHCGVRRLDADQAAILCDHQDDIRRYWDDPNAQVSPEAKRYLNEYYDHCQGLDEEEED